MTQEEKLEIVTKNFSLLPEEKQDYILGVLQALAFAHERTDGQDAIVIGDLEQNIELGKLL